MHALIVFILLGCAFAAENQESAIPRLDGKIVGGEAIPIEQVPYQVSLQYLGSHTCGASIISAHWAVTAAHCVSGRLVAFFTVRSGSSDRSSGGSIHPVSSIISHNLYNKNTLDYDIAVVKVLTAFNIGTSTVDLVRLPAAGSAPSPGVSALVSGWGVLSSNSNTLPSHLQGVWVPIVSKATCRYSYGTNSITDRMLCAGYTYGGKDACQGDSGGPLVANGVLVGVVSWGEGCAEANYPGVYADVGNLRTWIETQTDV